MDNKTSAILTIEEDSEFLHILRSSVFTFAQHEKIPAQKDSRHWRFHRPAIIRWIAGQAASDGTFTRSIAEAEK